MPGPTLQQMIEIVQQESQSADLLDQLSTAASLATELEEVGDALLGHYVDQCRRTGCSWTDISGALGVTKQAAHKRFSPSPTLERFTERARKALEAAQDAAQRLGHPYTGTEHILLGLFTQPEGLAARILTTKKVTAAMVEAAIPAGTATIPAGSAIPLTPLANAVLESTLKEALKMGHNYVGTEHVLLALYDVPDGLAAQILDGHGVRQADVREQVLEMLSGYQTAGMFRRKR